MATKRVPIFGTIDTQTVKRVPISGTVFKTILAKNQYYSTHVTNKTVYGEIIYIYNSASTSAVTFAVNYAVKWQQHVDLHNCNYGSMLLFKWLDLSLNGTMMHLSCTIMVYVMCYVTESGTASLVLIYTVWEIKRIKFQSN